MSRLPLIAAGLITAAAVGAIVFVNGASVSGPDGGLLCANCYTLPDGGVTPFNPDGSVPAVIISALPAVFGHCTVALPTGGYSEVTCNILGDGGVQLGATPLTFSCICASDAGPCLLSDGGQLGSGTYDSATATGVGCLSRPCVELSGWPGAPAGCAP